MLSANTANYSRIGGQIGRGKRNRAEKMLKDSARMLSWCIFPDSGSQLPLVFFRRCLENSPMSDVQKSAAPHLSRLRSYRLREPFSAASHLFGAFAALIGAVYLVYCCDGSYATVISSVIYGLALVSLFLISGLFHGLHCSEETLGKLERLDYAAIYFFIASTYTPACLFAIGGSMGKWLLISEWLLAMIGIWLALSRGPAHRNLQVAIFLAMGWGFLLALPSLLDALAPLPFNLLILGGVFYSVGAVIFALDWPCMFRSRLSGHDFWHVLVLLGSASHYLFVVNLVP